MPRLLPVLVLLAACGHGKKNQELGSSDVMLGTAGDGIAEGDQQVGTSMCVDEDGHVSVAWMDDSTGTPRVVLQASQDAGRSWMPGVVDVSHGETGEALAPDVACAGGNVFVAWEDTRDGELDNHNIYFSRSADGGLTFKKVKDLDDDADGKTMSLGPQIVAVGDDVYVTWFDSANGAYDIFVVASHDGGETFSNPVRIDGGNAGGAYSAWPQIAAEADGHVYVAWEDSRNGNSDIWFNTSSDGGETWGDDVRLDKGDDAGATNSFSPRISADKGVVYVVWHDERDGAGRDVFLNWSSDHGKTFASKAILAESDNVGFFDSLYPDVVVKDGVAHIAWQDARNDGFDVYYREAKDGAFAAAEVRMDTDGAGFANSIYPRVAVGDAGVVVAWQDDRGDQSASGYDDLHYNYVDGGDPAGDDLRIDSIEEGTHYAIDLDLGTYKDQLLAAWTDGRNGTADVYFHALKVGDEAQYVPIDTDAR